LIRRRTFLGLVAGGVGLGIANLGLPGLAGGSKKQVGVGVQLFTLRDLMEESVPKTLQLVAATGYSEVELAGYYNHSPADLRRALEAEGLRAPATHILLDALDKDFNAVLEGALELRCQYIVLPYLLEHQRISLDDYKRLADKMNGWGEACRKAGVRFAYHNHHFEFAPLENVLPYDIILQKTDPELVFLELDLYWVTKAGQDPVKLFEHHPGRFPLWHIKDMAADGSIADVGDGVIDFPRIFAVADKAGLERGFIEHDTTNHPEVTIRKGLAAMKHYLAYL